MATHPRSTSATHQSYSMHVKWGSRQALLYYVKLLKIVPVLLHSYGPQGCGPFVVVSCDGMEEIQCTPSGQNKSCHKSLLLQQLLIPIISNSRALQLAALSYDPLYFNTSFRSGIFFFLYLLSWNGKKNC